jgi:hypothetical protein
MHVDKRHLEWHGAAKYTGENYCWYSSQYGTLRPSVRWPAWARIRHPTPRPIGLRTRPSTGLRHRFAQLLLESNRRRIQQSDRVHMRYIHLTKFYVMKHIIYVFRRSATQISLRDSGSRIFQNVQCFVHLIWTVLFGKCRRRLLIG